nr:DUF6017 domain-containing protein [uncultured Oscillibacter sp.]
MPVFRVERNKGYTVMSNYHLRDKSLSLKAKGLLSQMLSLPDDWDYTLKGLALINRESKDAIRSAVNELERAGYIERHQTTDESGKFSSNEYIIHEQPVSLPPSLDKPSSENPTTGKPTLENPTQLNKDIQSKDPKITDPSITHSFPSLSPPPAGAAVAASPPERKRTEAATQSAVEIYRDIIKENIEYDHLLRHSKIDREELDGIVELLVETVCTARKTIRVAGDDYPAELVKAKLLKLNSGHIEFVMDCMRENTTKIRNIKKYLLAVLFNAPSTMGSYYTALVAHDMAEGKI